ncbi:hypothetical protein QFZ53_000205 [Microbacterium natoriense]|uniref:Uncharacterized protein n=2 Tax=Microbacterium natoriense TaxID=284570 RepID=A0AAW8ESV9_9MICO|nr:hypothetical protein [Microbacterium natoriense]
MLSKEVDMNWLNFACLAVLARRPVGSSLRLALGYRGAMSDAVALHVDEDGFFCLVAPDTYRGFVDEDWELEQLLTHFAGQMNAESLFIAYPGPYDTNETVVVADGHGDAPVLRQAVGAVNVGPGGLWLTDYTQLTMAAQFDDEAPTASYAIRLPIAEGRHRVDLRQLDGVPRYVLTITPLADDGREPVSAVPWFS